MGIIEATLSALFGDSKEMTIRMLVKEIFQRELEEIRFCIDEEKPFSEIADKEKLGSLVWGNTRTRMGIIEATLSTLFGDSKEMTNAKIRMLVKEMFQRELEEIRFCIDEEKPFSEIADKEKLCFSFPVVWGIMMGTIEAALSALFADSKEMIHAEIKKLEKERIQHDVEEFKFCLDEKKRRSKIADQYLTGWDLNFFTMRFADPKRARNNFEDAISELEEVKYIDPKTHLGVGMALTLFASQILAKDEALVYLKKIVESYKNAVNDAPENPYYHRCLEYATQELAACTREAMRKVSANECHPKLLKASTQVMY